MAKRQRVEIEAAGGGMISNFATWLVQRLNPYAQMLSGAGGVQIGRHDRGICIAEAVRSTAAAFQSQGLRKGDFVILLTDISPESALAYLGAMYAGCVVVPVDGRRGAHTLAKIAEQISVSAMWAPSSRDIERSGLRDCRVMTGLVIDMAKSKNAVADLDGGLAALMPTSGSTGTPRLVRVTHRNLIANTVDIIASQQLSATDRAMIALPLSYCFGASVLHSHLAAGGDVVFDTRVMFPELVVQALAEHRCTSFAGVPMVYTTLLNRSLLRRGELPSLRRWLQAGGRLDPDAIDRVRALTPVTRFYVMYGQTEATARITCLQPEDFDRKRGSVGRALSSVEIGTDADTGEIMVRGPSVTDGYWNDPKATALRFQDGWLRTGDLGHIDAEGFLWIEGRLDDFAKIAGVRVALPEVEACLLRLTGVREAAVVAVPHMTVGEALTLFVVVESSLVAERVRNAILSDLPGHWVIAGINIVSQLPTNVNGKVDRLTLGRLALSADDRELGRAAASGIPLIV